MSHDFNATAQLALQGFTVAGQLKLDPFLQSTFVTLVEGELKKAHRQGRLLNGATQQERASCLRVGMEKAADIVQAAAGLPYEPPVPELLKAIETAIRGQADRLR